MISFLGNNLDLPTSPDRWQKWRPTVSLGQFPDLLIDRIELLTQERFEKLSNTVVSDLNSVAPEAQVNSHYIEIEDPWNFEEMFQCLYELCECIVLICVDLFCFRLC